MAKRATEKSVETLKHDEAKRKNIPTAEYQSVLEQEQQYPKKVCYPRNRDLDPQLVWRGKDEQDWSDLVVHAPPLYIQEKVHPKVLIDDLLRATKEHEHESGGLTPDLFADFNGIPKGVDKTEFYQHDQNWSNRMILGDSLQVMASLAERESLRGKVQCIYFDPPYGIKFNSNFQWSTTSRDVKDGNAGHITREPEQVKAFRDTWRDGIHSYLTYLRDRLTVARDLLTESGSIFVQIGDENVHRVRALMDEVFGQANFLSMIVVRKTGGATKETLSTVIDFILSYARDVKRVKYRQLLLPKIAGEDGGSEYSQVELESGAQKRLDDNDRDAKGALLPGRRIFATDSAVSEGFRQNTSIPFSWNGMTVDPGRAKNWKTTIEGMTRLARASRLMNRAGLRIYKRFIDDFPVIYINNIWMDVRGALDRVYVVQTSNSVVQRCLLMATDPGDLVLDPTCGSGTTAYVAEQWGRRWITIDTSRVALALARARIMGARYPFYLLADSRDGQLKEAEVTRTAPSTKPVHSNIRHGFVYERVPHITLKSIANNAEVDVIWEQWQTKLETVRDRLNATLETQWQEWQIPRDADKTWPEAAKKLHAEWWQARISRQQEIDASIAAKAEFEYLYDKAYEDRRKVRVAGPFTVEGLSPHRVLGVDENDELIDGLGEDGAEYGAKKTFPEMILENLKIAGVQQAHKEDR
jgi:adenine-specific DNA-methyltransferase